MNKKKLVAIAVIAVVLIAAIVLAAQPGEKEQPEAAEVMMNNAVQAETKENGETAGSDVAINETEDSGAAEAQKNVETSSKNANNSSNVNADNNTTADETKPLIPEENVQLGVVPGADDGGLDDVEIEDAPSQNVTPTVPKQDAAESDEETELPADFDITKLTYEAYNAMSGAQQKQVIDMFGSVEDFMKWYRAVEALYQAEHPDIEIGADGVINAEDLIK